ncbi:hypothetical protein ABZS96_10195, partial [Streptomyces avermitilis]
EVGFLGMVRDEETLQASTYATRMPDDLSGRQVAQDKAARAGHTVQDTAGRTGGAVRDTVPGPVKTATTAVVQAGLRHRRPVLIAGAGAVVAAGLLRRRQGGRL